jgi:hypothetical protein
VKSGHAHDRWLMTHGRTSVEDRLCSAGSASLERKSRTRMVVDVGGPFLVHVICPSAGNDLVAKHRFRLCLPPSHIEFCKEDRDC